MSLRRCICLFAASLALVAATASPAAASASCARTYSYAGYDSPWYAHGVVATITVLTDPLVAAGHVAAWVGGGGGAGLGGTDEWLQVGVAGFEPAAGTGNEVYYEVALPHREPVYHKITLVPTLKPVRVSVLEMAPRWGWWSVWMNGRPVTGPIFLPASHGVWQPEV